MGYRAYLPVIAMLISAPMPAASTRDTAPVADMPQPGDRRVVAVQLAHQVTDMLDKISRHYPGDAPFASLAPEVRLWLVEQGRSRMIEGSAARKALQTTVQQQDDDHWVAHGAPNVQIDGSFGRFAVDIRSLERGRSIGGCLVLYGDAILRDATWSIVNLTATRRPTGCDGS